MQAGVEKHFDALALDYVKSREHQFSFKSQKRIVLNMLAGTRGSLLEVGCGPAVMTPELLEMGFAVQGIDVSIEMVRSAEKRMAVHPLKERSGFALGDVENLDYASGSFNAVVCMGVLEYLSSYSRALLEICRVLAPGGIAIFAVPNRACSYHVVRSSYLALQSVKRRLRGIRSSPDDVAHNPCVPWKFDRELEAAGLRKTQSQACNFIFFPLDEWLPRASESLNRALLPLAPSAVAPLLGAQYLVKAKKAPV